MLDVDRFKLINDQHGHSEGDKILKLIADLLKESRLDNEWVFRFAGDEFIILKRTNSPDGLVTYMEAVERKLVAHNRMDPTHTLAISYGMSFLQSGDIDDFMREMDDRMYEMKEEHHRQDRM
jgi:diguanylate cyclase (GGDEF)-like protein